MESTAKRLRAFVLDRATGKPVPKVPITAVAEIEEPETGTVQRITLGILASDHAGYLSFDLSNLVTPENSEQIRSIWVAPVYDEDARIDVLPGLRHSIDPWIVPIKVERSEIPEGTEALRLTSMQCVDVTDWKVSPGSFATDNVAILGEGGCEELLLSRAIERSFRFSQIVREISETPNALSPATLATCETGQSVVGIIANQAPAPLLASLFPGSVCYRRGALLEYEMTWQPIGHGLGQVLYSLPLAPCESVNIAIIDWAREDQVFRGEETQFGEQLLHRQRRDRVIDETVRATLDEWQRGGSFMGGLAVAGVFDEIAGTLGLGGSYSTSSGTRRVAADTTQRLADGILQSSSATRRLNSTVVVQASQRERETLQTRTVANHNHCHAMTVLYYEVVRHYCVMTRLARKQDVILVKYPIIEFKRDQLAILLRYRLILEKVLLDPKLSSCFDIAQRLYCAELDFDPANVVLAPDDFELRTLRLMTRTGPRTTERDSYTQRTYVNVLTHLEDTIPCRVIEPPRPLSVGVGMTTHPVDQFHLEGIRTAGIPSPQPSQLTPGAELFFTLEPSAVEGLSIIPKPVRWGNVKQIEFTASEGGGWELAHVRATTSHDGHDWILFGGDVGQIVNAEHSVLLDVTPYGGPRRPDQTLTAEERCCLERLINHLNDNKLYYNRAIWLAEDPDQRAQRFDGYSFQVGTERGRLIDFIENRIVGVVGDYIALPVAEGEDAFSQRIGTALEERIVSVPTRGAFAEAKLSHCNACEKRDVTRFWDWQESPCPEPPEITGISPGSRARDLLEATPSAMPQPTVGIQAPAEAPAPTGMGAVLELLGRPDIFRDMSGQQELAGLLTTLVQGAVDLEKTKIQSAAAVEQARIRAKAPRERGEGAGAPAQAGAGPAAGPGADGAAGAAGPAGGRRTTRRSADGTESIEYPSATELHDTQTVIQDGIDSGLYTPEQGAELMLAQWPGGSPGPGSLATIPSDWLLGFSGTPSVRTQTIWAAVTTMMLSWRDGLDLGRRQAYTVDEAMQLLDATSPGTVTYHTQWTGNHPIIQAFPPGMAPITGLDELLRATATGRRAVELQKHGSVFGASRSRMPSPEFLRTHIESSGPLWFTVVGHEGLRDPRDSTDLSHNFGVSGLIVTGIEGGGTPGNTFVLYLQAAGSQIGSPFRRNIEDFYGQVLIVIADNGQNDELILLHFPNFLANRRPRLL